MTDMRGKRVTSYVGDPMLDSYYMEPALAFAGLTWNDVTPIPVSSWGSGLRAVIEGSADVAVSSTPSGDNYELEASIHGIHWLPMPANDIAG